MGTFFKYVPSTFQLLGGILRTLQRRGFKLQRAAQSDKKGVGARAQGLRAGQGSMRVLTFVGLPLCLAMRARAVARSSARTAASRLESLEGVGILLQMLKCIYHT